MQKRQCTLRAQWRLVRGYPAQRLSAHYHLDCDFGTSLIAVYEEGEQVFLCATHATAIALPKDNSVAGVRLVETEISVASSSQGEPGKAESNNPLPDDQSDKPLERGVAQEPAQVLAEPRPASTKLARETIPSLKRPVPDQTYGNFAKAMVDETIWNIPVGDYDAYRAALQQGKSAAEAAQSAGGQLAIVYRKIGEYTLKIEALLSESKTTIDVSEVIDKPFEQAMLEIISNAGLSEAEKDSAIANLGVLQEEINRTLDRKISPLQAHRIARAIGDRANWGAEASLADALKPAFRSVYTSVSSAVRAAVPEASDLDERLANLHAAKSNLEDVAAANSLPSTVCT